MDQHISLIIIKIVVVMKSGYLKSCNALLLIHRGFKKRDFYSKVVK